MSSSLNVIGIRQELTQFKGQSNKLTSDEKLIKVRRISYKIFSYISSSKELKEPETTEIQKLLRETEALSERYQAHKPVGKSIQFTL